MALFNKLGLFKEPEAGNGWAPPAILDRGVIGQVCCVMDRDGRGQVLWENYGSLWLQTLGVHDEAAFARISLGPGAEPRVSANLDGAGVAAWVADVAGGRSVLGLPIAAWRTPGATRILFSTPGQVHHLQVAADRRGGALVVWCHEFDGLFEVMAKRFDVRARTWDEEPAKLGPRTTYPLEPRLAMNSIGLDVLDRKILSVIADDFGGGPVGLKTISISVGEEPRTIEDVYEPYLIQLGFIKRTPQGRMITNPAKRHLGKEGKSDLRSFL